MKEAFNFRIEVGRHMPDIDDLTLERDGHLDPEYFHIAEKQADKIIEETMKDGKSIIVFAVSPKRRAVESVNLVIDQIRTKAPEIKTIVNLDQDIREIDQGKFNLNPNYKYGDFVVELDEAGKVFWNKTSNEGDYNYHFGDPIRQEDGTSLYPEFADFFKEYGESYLEQNIRLYKAIVKLYERRDLLLKTKLVVMTHGAPLAIYKEMELIAHKILHEGFNPKIGTIMDLTWEYFKKRSHDIALKHAHVETIDVTPLLDPRIFDRLLAEIDYMEKLA
jgi:broad specificity phosphatase PhoE